MKTMINNNLQNRLTCHWLGGVTRPLGDFGYNSFTVQDIDTKPWKTALASLLHPVCKITNFVIEFFVMTTFVTPHPVILGPKVANV